MSTPSNQPRSVGQAPHQALAAGTVASGLHPLQQLHRPRALTRQDRAALAFEHIKIADRAKAKDQNGTQPLDLPFNRQTKHILEETDVYKLFGQGWDKLWSQDKSFEHAVCPMPPLHHVHILAIASPEQLADEVIRALDHYNNQQKAKKLLLWTWTDQADKTKREGYRVKFRWSIEAEPTFDPTAHNCHIFMGKKPWSFQGKQYHSNPAGSNLRQFIVDVLKFDKPNHDEVVADFDFSTNATSGLYGYRPIMTWLFGTICDMLVEQAIPWCELRYNIMSAEGRTLDTDGPSIKYPDGNVPDSVILEDLREVVTKKVAQHNDRHPTSLGYRFYGIGIILTTPRTIAGDDEEYWIKERPRIRDPTCRPAGIHIPPTDAQYAAMNAKTSTWRPWTFTHFIDVVAKYRKMFPPEKNDAMHIVGLDAVGIDEHAKMLRDLIKEPEFQKNLWHGAFIPHVGETQEHTDSEKRQSLLHNLWYAIHLGADRLAHAGVVQYDALARKILVEHRICLEICLISNERLLVWEGKNPKEQPYVIHKLLEEGVPFSVSSDDPSMFGIKLMAHDYALMTLKHGVGLHQIDWINRNTIVHCKAPAASRSDMLRRYNALAESRDTWLLSQPDPAFQQMAHSTEQPGLQKFPHVHPDNHMQLVHDIQLSLYNRQLSSKKALERMRKMQTDHSHLNPASSAHDHATQTALASNAAIHDDHKALALRAWHEQQLEILSRNHDGYHRPTNLTGPGQGHPPHSATQGSTTHKDAPVGHPQQSTAGSRRT